MKPASPAEILARSLEGLGVAFEGRYSFCVEAEKELRAHYYLIPKDPEAVEAVYDSFLTSAKPGSWYDERLTAMQAGLRAGEKL